ncbi:MAG: 3'-5' exonuclease, partial [Arcobacteraceae bacterium]
SVGLQILTIFKSKGLEFNTVIMLDRIKRKNVDKSSLLFEYESVQLKNIFYKIKGYENYNKDYEKALSKEKALSIEDEINILYVALTRAKNNMIVFKKSKSSVFDVLNMRPIQIGKVIQSENVSKNYENITKVLYKPLDLGTQEKQISKEKEFDENHLKAKYFGLATHYCLEMMNEFNSDNLLYSLNLAKTRYSNFLDEIDFLDIKNRLSLLVNNEKFISLLSDSQFISEQSLVYKEEIKVIDLLLFKDGNYYIIDYKTTKDTHVEHITQVAFYKKAIKDIFQTQNVFSYLVYLHANEVLISEV